MSITRKSNNFIKLCFSVCAARTGQPIVKQGPIHHQGPAGEEAELYEGNIPKNLSLLTSMQLLMISVAL